MSDHEWLNDLRRYWVLLAGLVGIIAFLLSIKQGQSQGVERYHVLRASQDTLRASLDTLKDNQQFMALILCEQLKAANAARPLPKRCEDVFHGWGY